MIQLRRYSISNLHTVSVVYLTVVEIIWITIPYVMLVKSGLAALQIFCHNDFVILCCVCVGTGYLTACFAVMVGPHGRAVGVEHIPELVNFSIKNIEKSAAAPLLKDGSLSVHVGGMFQGAHSFLIQLFSMFASLY